MYNLQIIKIQGLTDTWGVYCDFTKYVGTFDFLSFGRLLESSKSRPLVLPLYHKRQRIGPLVVGLEERVGVKDLAPLRMVVHVLEGHLERLLDEIKGAHDCKISVGGIRTSKPAISTLGQDVLHRLKPLGEELGEEVLGELLALLLGLGKLHLGELGPDVLIVTGDHVGLNELHVRLAGHPNLPGNEPCDGHGLRELLSVPVQHRHLAEGGGWLHGRPFLEADPLVLIVYVAGCQEEADDFALGLDIEVDKLDNRHVVGRQYQMVLTRQPH